MQTVLFDTQAAVDSLKDAGFSEEQAKANVRFVRDALEGGVATKADLKELSSALRKDMGELRAELRGEMVELRTELRGEMATLQNNMDKLFLRVSLLVIGTSGLLGAFIKFF